MTSVLATSRNNVVSPKNNKLDNFWPRTTQWCNKQMSQFLTLHIVFVKTTFFGELIPGIHLSTDPKNRETELVPAFTMKLKPTIAKQLLSWGAAFPDLTSVITAAKRYKYVDSVLPIPEADQSWKPAVLYTAKEETKPKQQFASKKRFTPRQDNATGAKLCWFYNKFHTAKCELPNNKCSKGFVHKCSQGFRQNCELRFHLQRGSRASNCNSNREHNSSQSSDKNVSANIVSTSDNSTLVDTVKRQWHHKKNFWYVMLFIMENTIVK